MLSGIRFGEVPEESAFSLKDMVSFHPEILPEAVTIHWEDLDTLETDETRLTNRRLVRILRELSRTGSSDTLKEMISAGLPLLMNLIEVDENKISELISFSMDEE